MGRGCGATWHWGGDLMVGVGMTGKNKVIEFDFDTEKDSVREVAAELLEQLETDSTALPHFEEVIEGAGTYSFQKLNFREEGRGKRRRVAGGRGGKKRGEGR